MPLLPSSMRCEIAFVNGHPAHCFWVFKRTSTLPLAPRHPSSLDLTLSTHSTPQGTRNESIRPLGTIGASATAATDGAPTKASTFARAATFVPSLSTPPAAPCPPPNPGSTHRRQPRGCAGTLTQTVSGRSKGATTSFLLRTHIRPTTSSPRRFFLSFPSSLVFISLRVHNHDAACFHVTGGGDEDKECSSRPRSWDGGVAAPGSSGNTPSCLFLVVLLLLLFLQQQYQQ